GAAIAAVDGQLDFLAVAMERGGEKLKETGKAQQRPVQGSGREADLGRPFSEFTPVGDPQLDFRIPDPPPPVRPPPWRSLSERWSNRGPRKRPCGPGGPCRRSRCPAVLPSVRSRPGRSR